MTGRDAVFAFDSQAWGWSPVPTCGQPPGWVHEPTARLGIDGRSIVVTGWILDRTVGDPLVENVDDWRLDLADGRWSRAASRPWRQRCFARGAIGDRAICPP